MTAVSQTEAPHWPSLRVESWAQFTDAVKASLPKSSASQRAYLWRGQADASWSLRTSLRRTLGELSPADALNTETALERQFRRLLAARGAAVAAHGNDPFNLWAVMQHHGAPTRLLDWTWSPYVAAYFAVVDRWDQDGALWIVHGRSLFGSDVEMDQHYSQAEAQLRKPDAASLLLLRIPELPNDRMVAQQGLFTLSPSLTVDHDVIIDRTCRPKAVGVNDTVYLKLVIAAEIKAEFLKHLAVMNITAASLFPGVDGIGRATYELARLSGSAAAS